MFSARKRFRVFMIWTLAIGFATLITTHLAASNLEYTIETGEEMLATDVVDGTAAFHQRVVLGFEAALRGLHNPSSCAPT